MAKTISLKELKPGDIVLFTPPREKGFWESEIIALLTKSTVSHSGLISGKPGHVLQEVPTGADELPLPRVGLREVYVRRLSGEPDTGVVVQIAGKYVEEKLPYPMSNLAFLGMYMLATDFAPDSIGGSLFINGLKVACYELMKLINKHTHPGTDTPMVCSQFAAACYDEAALQCGPQYKIHYNEKVATFRSLLDRIIDQLEAEEEKSYPVALEEDHPLLGGEIGKDEADSHLQKLADHLDQKRNGSQEPELLSAPSKIPEKLIASFYQYGKGILKLFGSKKDYPDKKEATAEEIRSVMEELLRIQETFVTPGDLLSNTTNLMDMGTLTYTQEELDEILGKNTDV